jgi:hypothetical protein
MPPACSLACPFRTLPIIVLLVGRFQVSDCESNFMINFLPPGRLIHSAPVKATAVVEAATTNRSGEAKELFSIERVVGGGNLRMKSTLLPDGSVQIHVDASEVPDNGNLVLHWGVSKSSKRPHDWDAAPEPVRPQGTSLFGDGKATRTPFNGGSLVVHVPEEFVSMEDGPATLVGIAVRSNPGSEEKWLHADDGAGAVSTSGSVSTTPVASLCFCLHMAYITLAFCV